jgi:hypothetical protein
MGDFRDHRRSFGGGEVTPEFFGMLTDAKFQTGLAQCRNFIVKPHGPVENRPGTIFVREVRDSTKLTRTLPFVYGFGQSLIIEFAEHEFRFHALGQTLLDGAVPYAVAHPYLEEELFEVTYAQSGDVIKLAHRNHPRRELRRLGALDWDLVDLTVGPVLSPPGGTSGTATPGGTPGTPYDTDYVISAITAEGDESLRSATITVSNNLFDDGAYNTLEWDAVAGAERYNIYKKAAGLFGYIGQTDQLEFRDDNIAPDLGTTPPLDIQLFDSPDNHPGAVAYQDQRAVWAGTINEPQNVWMSRAGTEDNFNFSIPPKDDDSIQFKIASRENNAIVHLVPMSDLIAATPAALWRISGGLTEVLTPLTVSAREQTYVGCSQTKPIKVGNNMLYIAARGGHLREFGFDGDRNGYISGDVSVRAPHLFDFMDIRSMTLQQAPYPVVWMCSTSGLLVGFTYIPEQQVAAFHWHDTQGFFEDTTTIYEEGRDVTYVVVRREINGATVRYIEHFADRNFDAEEDQFFVDSGYTYRSEDPVNMVVGIDWLEGMEVSILADGAVIPPQVITDGILQLPDGVEASIITFGLSYQSDLQTLPMALELQGYGQGMPKNVNAAFLRVYRSSGVFAGPTFEELTEAKIRTLEPLGTAPLLQTGELEIVVKGAWSDDGQVCVRQVDPLAISLLSMTLDVAVGGG